MIISHSRRFVFVHTMKTAGDSITELLWPDLARGDFVLRNDFQAWLRRATRRVDPRYAGLEKHSPANLIRERMGAELWESYYTFAFVRHPVDRVLSLYRYVGTKAATRRRADPRNLWYLLPPGRGDDPRTWPAMSAYLGSDSFSDFIRHPALETAAGMQPQSDFLSDAAGSLSVDFVGRFELLAEDIAAVQDALCLPQRRLDRRNVSRRASAAVEVSAEDRALLERRFRRDFEWFGYEPEPTVSP